MADKNIFDIYGGLDARESFGNESSILSYTEAKNIDIDGKVVRRARGQTQVSIAASGSTWAGIAPAPNGFIGGVNNDGKYYRTNLTTFTSTPVYTLIFYIPSSLSAAYDDSNSVVDLTWENRNGTDTDIEVWLKIDSGEYTLIETGLSNWTGGDIPIGVTHDVSALGYGTFYYKVRAANSRGYSDYSTETNVSVTIPEPSSFALSSYDYNSDTGLYDWSFSWNYPITATSFKLYRKTGTGSYSLVKTIDGLLREDIYNFTPSAGNTYTFKMTATVDGVETGASSEVVKVISSADIRLSAVTGVGNFTNNHTRLTWFRKTGNMGYEVYKNTNLSATYTLAGTVPTNQEYFDVPNPGAGNINYYKVRAINNVKGVFSSNPEWASVEGLRPAPTVSILSNVDHTTYHTFSYNLAYNVNYTAADYILAKTKGTPTGDFIGGYGSNGLGKPSTNPNTKNSKTFNAYSYPMYFSFKAYVPTSSNVYGSYFNGVDYSPAPNYTSEIVIQNDIPDDSAPTFISAKWDSIYHNYVIVKCSQGSNFPVRISGWIKPNPGENWDGLLISSGHLNPSTGECVLDFSAPAWTYGYCGLSYGDYSTGEFAITIQEP